jgi:hypothetical protein
VRSFYSDHLVGKFFPVDVKTATKGLDEGSVSRPSFRPIGHSGDAQQLNRLMPEEVRPAYEYAVTKPLDTALQN